ncbi:MAG: DUF721 domain-containing protein [Bacteroidetes bacterium]|nr:DUF721 domain-containing protein [Bacteroidota bacterium]
MDIGPAPRTMVGMTKARKKHMTRLSSMLDDLVAPSVRKRGFIISRLVSEWPKIAGDIAQWSRPAKLTLSRQGGGTLKLAIASGFGPVALQMRGAIIDRVNASFGYRAISEVVFVQSLLATTGSGKSAPISFTQSQTSHETEPEIPADQQIWELDAKLEAVESPTIRAALRQLGKPIRR